MDDAVAASGRAQQRAVQGIAVGHLERLLPDSKRVREGRISQNTGAYAPACGRLSLEKTEQVPDDTLAGLSRRIAPELERPVMLLDGSSLSLYHKSTSAGGVSRRAQQARPGEQ